MISKFYIENFRSIEKAEIDLGKITVLTGANNSGKSSVIYAMLVLRNFLANPNQSLENILVPGQMNLGGFKETVFQKDEKRSIQLGYEAKWVNLKKANFSFDTISSNYKLNLNPRASSVILNSLIPYKFELKNDIALPYPVNKNETFTISVGDSIIDIVWNGLQIVSLSPSKTHELFAGNNSKIDNLTLQAAINATANYYTNLDFVPQDRGVTKTFFNTVPLSNYQYTEDEIATLLATDRHLEGKVSSCFEKFIDKVFSVRFTPGTSNFYLQVRDRKTGFVTDLVNEGLGVNHLITILTKILAKNDSLICMDEPEVHLHPTYIDKLVDILVETSNTEYKQFLLSSHSEHLIAALLNRVAEGKLDKDRLKIYYLTKDGLKTNFELQPVNDKGQIEGGLKSFYESELNLAKDFFKTND